MDIMDINEQVNLLNFAHRKSVGAGSLKDVAAAQGYAQALCHAKIITSAKMNELQDLAEKSYQLKLAEKRTAKSN